MLPLQSGAWGERDSERVLAAQGASVGISPTAPPLPRPTEAGLAPSVFLNPIFFSAHRGDPSEKLNDTTTKGRLPLLIFPVERSFALCGACHSQD